MAYNNNPTLRKLASILRSRLARSSKNTEPVQVFFGFFLEVIFVVKRDVPWSWRSVENGGYVSIMIMTFCSTYVCGKQPMLNVEWSQWSA